MTFISTAYAASTTASSSVELWNAVTSSTGQFVQDSIPLFNIMIGFVVVLFVITLIVGSIYAMVKIIKGR